MLTVPSQSHPRSQAGSGMCAFPGLRLPKGEEGGEKCGGGQGELASASKGTSQMTTGAHSRVPRAST